MGKPLLEIKGLVRRFATGGQEIEVLKGIDLTIHAGEMVAIIGVSGSGKFLPGVFVYAGIDRRYFDVLGGGQVWQQMIALEDEPEVVPAETGQLVIGEAARFPPINPIAPLTGTVQATENIHQC